MLSRHKKKGYDGFKYFVGFLETLSKKKRKDIIEAAILEDPVYMIWIIKNMISMNYLITMDSKSIETFFLNCPNILEAVAKSIISHPLSEQIQNSFVPPSLKKELVDLMDIFKDIPPSAQEGAQFFLLTRVRTLQDQTLIEEFNWRLPGSDVALEPYVKQQSGDYELRYENGELALQGKIELTRREGIWQHFYSNGVLMAEGNYKKDLKDGSWIFYTTNNTVKAKGNFVEDRKDGPWIEIDSNNNEKQTCYRKGKVTTD